MRKPTKKQQAILDAEHEAKWTAFETFRNTHHGKTFTASVDWFDNGRGIGMVTITESFRLPIYACNISGRKTWYSETACVYYEKGQSVEVEIDVVSPSGIFAKGLTAGHFDSAGWDRIKDQNLAFRCDEAGNAMSGLFAVGAGL